MEDRIILGHDFERLICRRTELLSDQALENTSCMNFLMNGLAENNYLAVIFFTLFLLHHRPNAKLKLQDGLSSVASSMLVPFYCSQGLLVKEVLFKRCAAGLQGILFFIMASVGYISEVEIPNTPSICNLPLLNYFYTPRTE